MSSLSDLYSQKILELAATIKPAGHLAAPMATVEAHSKLCGSKMTVELVLRDGRVTDYAHTVKACLLGQSAASVMGREVIGSTPQELRGVGAIMRHMIKETGPAPTGRWADLGALEPVRAVKGRHASALLIFDAVDAALEKIEQAEATRARA